MKTRIILCGACGKMGGNVLSLLSQDENAVAVCGVDLFPKEIGIPVYKSFGETEVLKGIDIGIEKGEICVTGPGNMLGYDNEEDTNRTLIRHEDGKLWLHTGDTGYMNEDGIIYALGRGLAKRYNPENPDKSRRLVEIAMENRISDADVPGLIDSFFVIACDSKHEGYYVPYLYVVLEEGHTVESIQNDVFNALEEYQYPVEIIQIPERPFYHFKTNRLHMEHPYRRN